jgi:ribose transport system substrate-binding protein
VVIALDTDFTSDKKLAFVGTGNKDAAKSGGVAAVEAAKAKGIDKPTVLVVTGVQGDETHEARLAGYKEGVEEAGGEVVEVQYCDGLAEKAATAMESVMQMYPDGIDIVLSSNDDMAMSVVKIIKDSGNAKYADTIVCGFDGNTSAISAIKDGTLGMDIAQLGYDMGYKAVEAAVKALEGEQVDSFIDSGSKVVDSTNCDEYIDDMKAKGLWE